jgi:hypothetical protein
MDDQEKCVRCGEAGEDRRTLWMACFYAMEELGLPFEEQILFHADMKDLSPEKEGLSVELPNGPKINLAPGTVKCSGELTPKGFYTLRVCKACRAEWMQQIKAWFHCPKRIDGPTGTGAYIREHGATREMTQGEVEKFIEERGHEPCRVKQGDDTE